MNAASDHQTGPAPAAVRSGFQEGFAAPFGGLGLWLRKAALLKAGLVPCGIGLALTGVLAGVWVSQFQNLQLWMASRSSEAGAVRMSLWVVEPTLIVGGLGLGVFLLVVLGSLFAAPWQRRLAHKTEELLGADPSLQSLPSAPASQVMLDELKRMGGWLLWLLPGAALGLVPWIGALLTASWLFCALVLYLASLFTTTPLRARGLTRWSKLRFTWRHRMAMLGFGLGLTLLALIPLVQIACLPASAIGGVRLVRRLRAGE
jgi:uncharacterized protein involved in cysteine biosynthesis